MNYRPLESGSEWGIPKSDRSDPSGIGYNVSAFPIGYVTHCFEFPKVVVSHALRDSGSCSYLGNRGYSFLDLFEYQFFCFRQIETQHRKINHKTILFGHIYNSLHHIIPCIRPEKCSKSLRLPPA